MADPDRKSLTHFADPPNSSEFRFEGGAVRAEFGGRRHGNGGRDEDFASDKVLPLAKQALNKVWKWRR